MLLSAILHSSRSLEATMHRAGRRLLIVLIIVAAAGACMGRAQPGGPRSQSDAITVTEIERRGPFSSMYEMIQILRPRWVRSSGPDTFVGQSGQVQAHIDGNWVGPVQNLRNLAAHGVTSVRWLGPVDAAARYGLDHGHGAVIISTAPVH